MRTAVEFKSVDIIFGNNRREALAMLDAGATRQEILAKTGALVTLSHAARLFESTE